MAGPNRPEIIPEYIVIGDDSFEDLDLSPDEIELLKRTCDDDYFQALCNDGFPDDLEDESGDTPEDSFPDPFP
jgi:hypothetical protein